MASTPVYPVLGLTPEEYQRICDVLEREPSPTELAMFSVEWSEHCGYPRSREFLSTLPRKGKFAPLVGTDAGGIVVDGRIVVFKVESHNHPSQVEPKAGAATGVGGIVRDILSMGARPVALLDSLRFGGARDPMTAHFVRGVVDGIQHYGNCIGVPTVGGEVTFDDAYAGNCLVNVMCVGVLEPGQKVMTSEAPADLSVMFLGSRTGRDGIGGCSVLASREFREEDQKRPTVQIGDPFAGKCLIEATLEAIASGAVIAMKDMGAAGLTCTTSEMAAAGGVGMEIDLDRVPRLEARMEPFELMMSESQERMLAAVVPGREDEVIEIYHRWGLQAQHVGHTLAGNDLVIRDQGRVVAQVPVNALTSPEPIHLPYEAPPPQAAVPVAIDVPGGGWGETLLRMMSSPNVCSRAWIFRQYDHTVQTNTIVPPGRADAAVIRLPRTGDGPVRGLAATMDANPRFCALDPYEGARQAVAEAARNLVCVGAEPAGVTDCLNFGNPEKPDRFWQFVRGVAGIGDACTELGLPVVSGNVSFFNESPRGAVLPTPTIGMVGVVEDVNRVLTMAFPGEGWDIVLLGDARGELGGSEYLAEMHGTWRGPLATLDLAREKTLQGTVLEAHGSGILGSAHDLSEGGLMVAVAESCLAGGVGARLDLTGLDTSDSEGLARVYFGEAPSRIVVTVQRDGRDALAAIAERHGLPFRVLGTTAGRHLVVRGPGTEEWAAALAGLRRHHGMLPDILGL